MGALAMRAPIMEGPIMDISIIDDLKVSVSIMSTLTLHAPIMSYS